MGRCVLAPNCLMAVVYMSVSNPVKYLASELVGSTSGFETREH